VYAANRLDPRLTRDFTVQFGQIDCLAGRCQSLTRIRTNDVQENLRGMGQIAIDHPDVPACNFNINMKQRTLLPPPCIVGQGQFHNDGVAKDVHHRFDDFPVTVCRVMIEEKRHLTR